MGQRPLMRIRRNYGNTSITLEQAQEKAGPKRENRGWGAFVDNSTASDEKDSQASWINCPIMVVDPKGKAIEVPISEPYKKKERNCNPCLGDLKEGEAAVFCHVCCQSNQGAPRSLSLLMYDCFNSPDALFLPITTLYSLWLNFRCFLTGHQGKEGGNSISHGSGDPRLPWPKRGGGF